MICNLLASKALKGRAPGGPRSWALHRRGQSQIMSSLRRGPGTVASSISQLVSFSPSFVCRIVCAVCACRFRLSERGRLYLWTGHTAQPNTSAAGLERENLILGYSAQRERRRGAHAGAPGSSASARRTVRRRAAWACRPPYLAVEKCHAVANSDATQSVSGVGSTVARHRDNHRAEAAYDA